MSTEEKILRERVERQSKILKDQGQTIQTLRNIISGLEETNGKLRVKNAKAAERLGIARAEARPAASIEPKAKESRVSRYLRSWYRDLYHTQK